MNLMLVVAASKKSSNEQLCHRLRLVARLAWDRTNGATSRTLMATTIGNLPEVTAETAHRLLTTAATTTVTDEGRLAHLLTVVQHGNPAGGKTATVETAIRHLDRSLHRRTATSYPLAPSTSRHAPTLFPREVARRLPPVHLGPMSTPTSRLIKPVLMVPSQIAAPQRTRLGTTEIRMRRRLGEAATAMPGTPTITGTATVTETAIGTEIGIETERPTLPAIETVTTRGMAVAAAPTVNGESASRIGSAKCIGGSGMTSFSRFYSRPVSCRKRARTRFSVGRFVSV